MKGNAAAVVWMDPLFVIPHQMYTGYMTLYMLEFNLSLIQVGIITSISLIARILFMLFSAYITDRLGRRVTTILFDSICWIGGQVFWLIGGSFEIFVIGALVNASVQVVGNSIFCLMLEDSTPDVRFHAYNFLQVASILSGFFAPLGGLLIRNMTIVPAMRMMLTIGLVCVILQVTIRYYLTSETVIGKQKMMEMKHKKIGGIFKSYIPILARIFKNKLLMLVILIRSLNNIQTTIRVTFLIVLLTKGLGFPPENFATFQVITAVITLLVLLFITPNLSANKSNKPLYFGIAIHIVATVLLLVSHNNSNYLLLICNTVLSALATGIITPRIDAISSNILSNEDRTVGNAMMSGILLMLSTPFGYIGGLLSNIDLKLPFVLILVIFILCLILVGVANRIQKEAEIS